jgi:hypothetical protein
MLLIFGNDRLIGIALTLEQSRFANDHIRLRHSGAEWDRMVRVLPLEVGFPS